MGLMESLFGKQESVFEEQREQVIIPEHRQKQIEKEQKEKAKQEIEEKQKEEKEKKRIIFSGTKPLFEIEEMYTVGGIAMVKGRVLRGRIKARSRIVSDKKKFSIKEVRKNNQKVEMLLEGELGTLFLNQLKGFRHRTGDIVLIE